jgi:hypothetical protein
MRDCGLGSRPGLSTSGITSAENLLDVSYEESYDSIYNLCDGVNDGAWDDKYRGCGVAMWVKFDSDVTASDLSSQYLWGNLARPDDSMYGNSQWFITGLVATAVSWHRFGYTIQYADQNTVANMVLDGNWHHFFWRVRTRQDYYCRTYTNRGVDGNGYSGHIATAKMYIDGVQVGDYPTGICINSVYDTSWGEKPQVYDFPFTVGAIPWDYGLSPGFRGMVAQVALLRGELYTLSEVWQLKDDFDACKTVFRSGDRTDSVACWPLDEGNGHTDFTSTFDITSYPTPLRVGDQCRASSTSAYEWIHPDQAQMIPGPGNSWSPMNRLSQNSMHYNQKTVENNISKLYLILARNNVTAVEMDLVNNMINSTQNTSLDEFGYEVMRMLPVARHMLSTKSVVRHSEHNESHYGRRLAALVNTDLDKMESLFDGHRHHLVVTHERAVGTHVYIDGVVAYSVATEEYDVAPSSEDFVIKSDAVLRIGSSISISNNEHTKPFAGSVLFASVHSEALPAEVVLNNFNAQLPNTPPAVKNVVVMTDEDECSPVTFEDTGVVYDYDRAIQKTGQVVTLTVLPDSERGAFYKDALCSEFAPKGVALTIDITDVIYFKPDLHENSQITSSPYGRMLVTAVDDLGGSSETLGVYIDVRPVPDTAVVLTSSVEVEENGFVKYSPHVVDVDRQGRPNTTNYILKITALPNNNFFDVYNGDPLLDPTAVPVFKDYQTQPGGSLWIVSKLSKISSERIAHRDSFLVTTTNPTTQEKSTFSALISINFLSGFRIDKDTHTIEEGSKQVFILKVHSLISLPPPIVRMTWGMSRGYLYQGVNPFECTDEPIMNGQNITSKPWVCDAISTSFCWAVCARVDSYFTAPSHDISGKSLNRPSLQIRVQATLGNLTSENQAMTMVIRNLPEPPVITYTPSNEGGFGVYAPVFKSVSVQDKDYGIGYAVVTCTSSDDQYSGKKGIVDREMVPSTVSASWDNIIWFGNHLCSLTGLSTESECMGMVMGTLPPHEFVKVACKIPMLADVLSVLQFKHMEYGLVSEAETRIVTVTVDYYTLPAQKIDTQSITVEHRAPSFPPPPPLNTESTAKDGKCFIKGQYGAAQGLLNFESWSCVLFDYNGPLWYAVRTNSRSQLTRSDYTAIITITIFAFSSIGSFALCALGIRIPLRTAQGILNLWRANNSIDKVNSRRVKRGEDDFEKKRRGLFSSVYSRVTQSDSEKV